MSGSAAPALSVVIPVYNSGRCLPELIRQLSDVLAAVQPDYEIIFVDDSSPDDSWSVIQAAARANPRIRGLQLMHNEGQMKATLCGLRHAAGTLVATMDDDLQHPPDQLPRLLDALAQHPEIDCVMGYFEEKHHALYRNWGSALITRINTWAFGMPAGLRSSAFRVLRRRLVDAMCAHHTATPVIQVLIFSTTKRVLGMPVAHAPRFAGCSNYSLARQFRLAMDNICNATVLPLKMVTGMGVACCVLAVALGGWVLVRHWMGLITVPGWTTVVVLLTFFSGMILLSLGALGEYLGRVLAEVRGRPSCVIRETAGDVRRPPPPSGTPVP